jgi:hypothetical protein
MSGSASHEMSPPHQSARARLGVCPLSRRATSVRRTQRQPFGGSGRREAVVMGTNVAVVDCSGI